MKEYKIDILEPEFPVLLTKSILYNLIWHIGRSRSHILKIEATAIIDVQYIRYLLNIFESNQEYLSIFRVSAGTDLSAKDIYTVFMKQFRILVFKEQRCFDSVELEMRNVEVRYCFICSAQFYGVCQQNPEAVDLNGFV